MCFVKYYYKIGFNTIEMKYEAVIIELCSPRNSVYDDLVRSMNCEGIDLQDYSEDIVMIVDDNGFYKASNPIFQVKTKFGDIVELAGEIIFAKNIETELSTDIGNLSNEDILYLRDTLKIQLIGLTKEI